MAWRARSTDGLDGEIIGYKDQPGGYKLTFEVSQGAPDARYPTLTELPNGRWGLRFEFDNVSTAFEVVAENPYPGEIGALPPFTPADPRAVFGIYRYLRRASVNSATMGNAANWEIAADPQVWEASS